MERMDVDNEESNRELVDGEAQSLPVIGGEEVVSSQSIVSLVEEDVIKSQGSREEHLSAKKRVRVRVKPKIQKSKPKKQKLVVDEVEVNEVPNKCSISTDFIPDHREEPSTKNKTELDDKTKQRKSTKKTKVIKKTIPAGTSRSQVKVKRIRKRAKPQGSTDETNVKKKPKTDLSHIKLVNEIVPPPDPETQLNPSGTERFICKVCQLHYDTLGSYRCHYRLAHRDPDDGPKPYQCEKCPRGFYHKHVLVNHIKFAHFEGDGPHPFQCNFCNKLMSCERTLRSHIAQRHTNKFQFHCHICQKGFDCKGYMENHIKLVHSGELVLKCEHCPATFTTKKGLVVHTKKHLDPTFTYNNRTEPGPCHICGKLVKQMASHLQSHSLPSETKRQDWYLVTCSKCSLKMHAKHYDAHLKRNCEEKLTCPTCKRCFRLYVSYKAHMERHETKSRADAAAEPKKCPVCGKTLKNDQTIKRHIKRHQAETSLPLNVFHDHGYFDVKEVLTEKIQTGKNKVAVAVISGNKEIKKLLRNSNPRSEVQEQQKFDIDFDAIDARESANNSVLIALLNSDTPHLTK
jgi:hypothetical protein